MTHAAVKARLRGALAEKRRSMSFEDAYRLSLQAQRNLVESRFFRGLRRVALYASFQNEVFTDEIFRAAASRGVEAYYPRVDGGRLLLFRVEGLDELDSGAYRIREPSRPSGDAADVAAIDLVVVPGVAFDSTGGRLGFGKGFYDRLLAGYKGAAVGLCYDFQLLKGAAIPVEPHDVKVRAIATETGVVEFGV